MVAPETAEVDEARPRRCPKTWRATSPVRSGGREAGGGEGGGTHGVQGLLGTTTDSRQG